MDIKTDAAKTFIRQRLLIFLDTETTGLEVQKTELIEIGALKTSPDKPFKILDQLNLKIKPEHLETADKVALRIVKYNKEDWKDALDLKTALKALDEFADGGVLVGFNVTFDWAVLDKAYHSLGRSDPFYYHRLDVMCMAYLKLYCEKSIKRFSLGQLCQYYQIPRVTKHQALDDAQATYQLFLKLMNVK